MLDMRELVGRWCAYLGVVLFEEEQNPLVVLESDALGFREHLQRGHVSPIGSQRLQDGS